MTIAALKLSKFGSSGFTQVGNSAPLPTRSNLQHPVPTAVTQLTAAPIQGQPAVALDRDTVSSSEKTQSSSSPSLTDTTSTGSSASNTSSSGGSGTSSGTSSSSSSSGSSNSSGSCSSSGEEPVRDNQRKRSVSTSPKKCIKDVNATGARTCSQHVSVKSCTKHCRVRTSPVTAENKKHGSCRTYNASGSRSDVCKVKTAAERKTYVDVPAISNSPASHTKRKKVRQNLIFNTILIKEGIHVKSDYTHCHPHSPISPFTRYLCLVYLLVSFRFNCYYSVFCNYIWQ